MSETKKSERSALRRVVKLPLVSSALQLVTAVYVGAKGRYPLLGIVGRVAELSVIRISSAASSRTAPLLKSLESEIETVNGYAVVGLEQLEKSFPFLQQSADEVIERLKETFFLTLGDVQSRVNEELDSMTDRWERVLKLIWHLLEEAQASGPGQSLTSGLDEVLSRSEEAVAYYLPLPPTLRREWEIRVQSYEDEDGDEDEDDEPRMWTRVRSLLLFLYLQLCHRFQQLKERVDSVIEFLGDAADVTGLTGLMEGVSSLLQLLFSMYASQMQRVVALRSLMVAQFLAGVRALMELPPIQQLLALPAQVRPVMDDLLKLGQILIQLLINTTPLYDLLQQTSDQNVSEFDPPDGATRRNSANSLFLKAMDGRLRRRRSLYARYRRGSSGSALNPAPTLSPASSSGPAQALSPTPVPTPDPARDPTSSLARATSPAPFATTNVLTPESAHSSPNPDLPEALDVLLPPHPAEAHHSGPDPNMDEAPDLPEVQVSLLDSYRSEALDVVHPPNPAEVQDSFPDPDLPAAPDVVLPPNPADAQDSFPDPDLAETPSKAPSIRIGSLMKDCQLAGSLEPDSPTLPSSNMIYRRSSATEVLFAPILQFVSHSQRAFEYLSSSSHSEDQVKAETNEQ